MKSHEATEQAYKNGYDKGYEDGRPKWIPVTERLPENNTRVVVCYNNPIDGEKTVSSDVFWKGHWVRFGETVTHWMPLPSAEGLV